MKNYKDAMKDVTLPYEHQEVFPALWEEALI